MKSVLLEAVLDVLVGFLETGRHGEHEDAKQTVARREVQRQKDVAPDLTDNVQDSVFFGAIRQ